MYKRDEEIYIYLYTYIYIYAYIYICTMHISRRTLPYSRTSNCTLHSSHIQNNKERKEGEERHNTRLQRPSCPGLHRRAKLRSDWLRRRSEREAEGEREDAGAGAGRSRQASACNRPKKARGDTMSSGTGRAAMPSGQLPLRGSDLFLIRVLLVFEDSVGPTPWALI